VGDAEQQKGRLVQRVRPSAGAELAGTPHQPLGEPRVAQVVLPVPGGPWTM
jgi:hypothetical protein